MAETVGVDYALLRAEPYWAAEFEPPALARLLTDLRAFFGHSRAQTGAKGDNRHLSGRHRSRNWDLYSAYCVNRGYATTDPRDRRGNGDWLRGFDVGISGPRLFAASRRLDTAVRAGQLPGLAEWFGTFDAQRVVGWFEGHASSSDSSHLWHLHVGVWTGHADDPATTRPLYELITGDDMTPAELLAYTLNSPSLGRSAPVGDWLKDGYVARKDIEAVRTELAAQRVLLEQLLARVQPGPSGPLELSPAAVAEIRDAVADLGEGGAAAVRADS